MCATVFATGVMSETDKGRQVMAIIRPTRSFRDRQPHDVPLRPRARRWWLTDHRAVRRVVRRQPIRQEMTDAEAILRDAPGQSPVPYCAHVWIGQQASSMLSHRPATRSVLWDIDTVAGSRPAQGGRPPRRSRPRSSTTRQRSNVLCSTWAGYETLDSLRLIVPGLRDRGFTLTSPLRPAELADRDRGSGQWARGPRAEVDDRLPSLTRVDPCVALGRPASTSGFASVSIVPGSTQFTRTPAT